MENKSLDEQAMELAKKLESKKRFSQEWFAVIREVETWVKKNGRPLYYTYSED